jgi:hypothetical protein
MIITVCEFDCITVYCYAYSCHDFVEVFKEVVLACNA